MGYRDLSINKCYETSENKTELLDEFYIPMLEETVKYFRIAGFFSSTSLAIASKGIAGLIKNGGIMKLLISPEISDSDYEILKSYSNNELPNNSFLFKDFDINDFASEEHLQALAWMLANNKLEIKIVVAKNSVNSLFHQKIGIGFDKNGDILSFSGSINETAKAWLSNIEEFKTFKSWEPEQLEYLSADLKKFNSFWNEEREDIARVFSIPNSIKSKIINVKPRDIYDLSLMKKYSPVKKKDNKLELFTHQERAVKKWLDNNKSLLFEMATGTGKTRTAIGCAIEQLKTKEKTLFIVATPQNTLSRQWKTDIEYLKVPFERQKIIDGSNSKWKSDLEICMLDIETGQINNAIIYSTHVAASSSEFIRIIKNNKRRLKIMFICDEVHAIGSEHQRLALLNEYEYRVGLSATPERMFDENGTSYIRKYFGSQSFEFTITDALNTINPYTKKPFLNQFYYYPCFVNLSSNEQAKYNSFSRRIAYLMNEEVPDIEKINILRAKRADILKNAEEKLTIVESIIDELNRKTRIKDTIIFSTDKQIMNILNFLFDKGINRSKITENESASKKMGINGLTEREEIISQFKQGNLQVLVGIKCLDEGIDIKNARIAILMASSTNPREYVQRVGRVIRPNKDKEYSIIYDLIVKPQDEQSGSIIEKEVRRAMMIAKDAINFNEVKRFFEECGVDVNAY